MIIVVYEQDHPTQLNYTEVWAQFWSMNNDEDFQTAAFNFLSKKSFEFSFISGSVVVLKESFPLPKARKLAMKIHKNQNLWLTEEKKPDTVLTSVHISKV